MGKYLGPVCRLCRAEGTKLLLKGEKCYTDKCPFTVKKHPPGERKREYRRRKLSDYGIRLREKQKAKRYYDVREEQFRLYYARAARSRGKTGEVLLQLLERRLVNVVWLLGFAPSRRAARLLISHGHFLVNGKKVTIPSYLVKPGDVIQVREKSKTLAVIHEGLKSKREKLSGWLEVDKAKLEGRVLSMPTRESIPIPINEQLIVEFYSR